MKEIIKNKLKSYIVLNDKNEYNLNVINFAISNIPEEIIDEALDCHLEECINVNPLLDELYSKLFNFETVIKSISNKENITYKLDSDILKQYELSLKLTDFCSEFKDLKIIDKISDVVENINNEEVVYYICKTYNFDELLKIENKQNKTLYLMSIILTPNNDLLLQCSYELIKTE
jgi:hypothetical protein